MEEPFITKGKNSATGQFHMEGDRVELVCVRLSEFLQDMAIEYGVKITSYHFSLYWNAEKGP